jgi:hypothetical protein
VADIDDDAPGLRRGTVALFDRAGQITEERAAKHIRPFILALFVVAEARIDDDAATRSFDYECMN